jgi:ubiquinone biosynthesis O-methyltransferase
MKNIGFPVISTKNYGGDVYIRRVAQTLEASFNVEKIEIIAKHLGSHRYLKFFEFFYNLCKLKGEKDLWIRDFYSCISKLFDKTKGQNMALLFHLDFSGFPVLVRPIFKFVKNIFLYRSLRKFDFIVVISEYWKNFLAEKGFRNIHKIYCGFDLNNFDITEEEVVDFKRKYNIEGKPIIYLGNCQKAKGVVESYQQLKDLDAYFITSSRKQVDIPALNFNLDYRGYLTLLKASSVVLTMSKFQEGWCMTAHEAMILKTPVIGSGLGGMRELLEGGKQIVCESFANLREKVEFVLKNEDVRKKMGEDGFNFAKDFTKERFEKSWLDLVSRATSEDKNQTPLGDKGIIGERDDMLKPQASGRRGVYEHIMRYKYVINNSKNKKKILDLGCGLGYGSSILLKAGNEVYGVDVSQDAINYAKINYPGINYTCCSADNLPFNDNYFDSVVAHEIIEHVKNPEKVIKEICRVLKKDGDVFISTPNPRHFSNVLKHIFFGKPYPEKVMAKNIYHIKEFYYEEFISFLKKANLKIISQYGQTLSILPPRVEALLGKFPVFYKLPVLLGYFFPKYAENVIVRARK